MTAIGEATRTARTRHHCDVCEKSIQPGTEYVVCSTPPSDESWPDHWNRWRKHVVCPLSESRR